MALGKPAKRITLLAVIDAVEPLGRSQSTLRRPASVKLNRKVDAMLAELRKAVGKVTLADVAKKSS